MTILNEVGLDPGFDHLGAVDFIDEVKAQGGQVSAVGGVPVSCILDGTFLRFLDILLGVEGYQLPRLGEQIL